MLIDEGKYPESAQHVQEAQEGEIWRGDQSTPGEPKPQEVTIDRPGADINWKESLNGIQTRVRLEMIGVDEPLLDGAGRA